MTASSSGTASNTILVGLPVNASADNFLLGTGIIFISAGTRARYIYYQSATTVGFSGILTQDLTPSASTTPTIVSGDVFHLQFAYEAA
jgi:hypothetical protein